MRSDRHCGIGGIGTGDWSASAAGPAARPRSLPGTPCATWAGRCRRPRSGSGCRPACSAQAVSRLCVCQATYRHRSPRTAVDRSARFAGPKCRVPRAGDHLPIAAADMSLSNVDGRNRRAAQQHFTAGHVKGGLSGKGMMASQRQPTPPTCRAPDGSSRGEQLRARAAGRPSPSTTYRSRAPSRRRSTAGVCATAQSAQTGRPVVRLSDRRPVHGVHASPAAPRTSGITWPPGCAPTASDPKLFRLYNPERHPEPPGGGGHTPTSSTTRANERWRSWNRSPLTLRDHQRPGDPVVLLRLRRQSLDDFDDGAPEDLPDHRGELR